MHFDSVSRRLCGAFQDGVVARILLPSVNMAPVELEVLQDAAEVAPYVPLLSPKQLVAVISAPRLFVDRTGLNIKPIHGGRYSPDFGGYSLLGDSTVSSEICFIASKAHQQKFSASKAHQQKLRAYRTSSRGLSNLIG